jgi:hypothetical protein
MEAKTTTYLFITTLNIEKDIEINDHALFQQKLDINYHEMLYK